MTKLATLASRIPFAHLLGVKAADNVEDDEDKDKKKDAKKAEDDSGDEEAKAKGKAEDDDKKPADDDSDKEKKDAKGKKAQEDEDDDHEKMQADAQGERARCAAIVAHGVKTDSLIQACSYAFDTDMSATVAIATLDATAAHRKPAASGGLNERMAGTQVPVVGPEANAPAADSPAAVAAMVIASASKASGKA